MQHALAIDVGGTKCDVLLAQPDGTVLRRGQGSVPDGASGRGAGRSEAAIAAALSQALHGVAISHLSVTHNGQDYMVPILTRCLTPQARINRHSEADMALALAGVDAGIVVNAGTGAFVHGRQADGRRVHLDGLGPILGDYGSAYQVGQQALRAGFRSGRHARHETSLAGAVFRFCVGDAAGPVHEHRLTEIETSQALGSFLRLQTDRATIAALAPLVDREAARGDHKARAILADAARDLGETLRDVIEALDWAKVDAPLLGIGGNLKSACIWTDLCAIAARLAPGLRPRRLAEPLALGGLLCLLAPTNANHDAEGIRANLHQSLQSLEPYGKHPLTSDLQNAAGAK